MTHKRGIRTNMALLLFLGGSILLASTWVFLLILKNVYGRYEVSDFVPSSERIQAAFAGDRPTVAVLSSAYSEDLRSEGGSWVQGNLAAWETFLQSTGISYVVIDDTLVERGGLTGYTLLILPGTSALSNTEIDQIKAFIDRGGSVFATSGTGSYSDLGIWRGWDFLSEVFGLQFTRDIKPDEELRIHTLRGELPITAGIPTGFALKVATWDRPIACEVLEPRTTQASFWYNFVNDSGLVAEGVEKTTGIAYGTYGQGRFVWMGFELNSVLGEQRDYVYFDMLCRRAVEWLTFSPTILLKDWPSRYDAAAVFAVSLTRNSGNVANLFPLLKSEKIPVTFFVDPESQEVDASLLKQLSTYGEIGAVVSLPPEPASPSAGPEQEYRQTSSTTVASARSIVESLTGATVDGALSRSGRYTNAAVHELLAGGYSFVVSDSMTDRSVPEVIIKGSQSLVALTKTARGDREVVREFGLSNPEFQLYTYKEDVDRVLFQGGVYLSLLHTHLQCRPENVPVIKDLALYLRSKNVWLATASDIQRWWARRNALEVTARQISRRRVAIVISNPSRETIRDAVVKMFLNRDVSGVELTSDIIFTPIPVYQFEPQKQQVDIWVPALEPGKSFSYFVDYDLHTS